MPYIGKNLVGILKEPRTSDTMTGDGSDTTLTLTDTPGSTNNVLVFLDGIRQAPVTDYTVMGNTLTFTTAPEAGVLVVALTGSASSIDPKMGSVTSSKIVDGMVGNAKIVTLSASKLTGTLPAISGANLTNISGTGIDNVTSDPTISENPSGGVGTIQLNQNSGEMFICTDATAGANVWINVGSGDGDVSKPFGGLGGGTVSGYTSGGEPSASNIINKFAFASGATASDHGNITQARGGCTGHSSATQGFTSTGYAGGYKNTIDKFNFAADATASDHGDINNLVQTITGNSSSTHGFVSGGGGAAGLRIKQIDKFTFATAGNATDHGDLALIGYGQIGTDSRTDGYCSGGYVPSLTTSIDKFSHASSNSTVAQGDLSVAKSSGAGQSSTKDGYFSGGYISAAYNRIDRHAFNSDSTATDVGVLTITRTAPAGSSSTTQGFTCGGKSPNVNTIDKFSFASDANATDHGDLFSTISELAGHQV